MSSRSASNQPRARAFLAIFSIRASTCPSECRSNALRAVIGAALVAAVAVHADPRHLAGVLDPLPDEARQVFQRRRPERLDLVEELVVERLLHLGHAAFEQAEIEHHAGRGIGRAAHADLGAERMAVDFLAGRAHVVPGSACAASNRNDFVNSHILKIWSCPIQFYLMPSVLCVCRLSRHLRMAQAVVDRARGVLDHVRAVHRLQREALEGETGEILRRRAGLRIDQLQFVAAPHHELGAGFRADADPVHAVGRLDRAVGLDADREAARMQRVDEGRIHLQQRLAAGQHHVAVGSVAGPLRGDGVGEFVGRGVAAAQRAVGADEVGVAKLAGRGGAVLLAAAPQVAAGETAKHRRAAGMGAFALQGQKDFLDRVTHHLSLNAAEPVCRSASPSAMAAAIATLSERKSGLIGITSRASAAAATSSGTPADSRPNSRTSSRR